MKLTNYRSFDLEVRHEQVEWRVEECGLDPFLVPQPAVEVELDRLSLDIERGLKINDPSEVPNFQQSDLEAYRYELEDRQYEGLGDVRMLYIGAGAGSISLGSYMRLRGVRPRNLTFADPKGWGGIWATKWARTVGFNNPEFMTFNDEHGQDPSNRTGANMYRFLRGMATSFLSRATLHRDSVVDLQRRPKSGEWIAITQGQKQLEADMVVIASGRPTPKKINGQRLRSNLDDVPRDGRLILERNQRRLTDEELGSGSTFVLIGLGNSTAAMLHQIHVYEDVHNVNVNYVVLTDNSQEVIDNPTEAVGGRSRSLFRDPEENYLTGYAADLPRERRVFERTKSEGHIVTGVHEISYNQYDHELRVFSSNRRTSDSYRRPVIFALIGHERDNTLFKSAGAMAARSVLSSESEQREPTIRVSDGAVHTRRDGYNSNLFAIGAAAAGSYYTSAVVLPGIWGQIPATALTMGLRAEAGRSRPNVVTK